MKARVHITLTGAEAEAIEKLKKHYAFRSYPQVIRYLLQEQYGLRLEGLPTEETTSESESTVAPSEPTAPKRKPIPKRGVTYKADKPAPPTTPI